MTPTALQSLRCKAQGLSGEGFKEPQGTVSWLGAMQAQNYTMARWGIGIRTKGSTLSSVSHALDSGQLLRTHVLRPTWHIVAAEDLLWMLKLTGGQIRQPMLTRDKALGIQPKEYLKANRALEKIFTANAHLTRTELAQSMGEQGVKLDMYRLNHFIFAAESEGLICSGQDKAGKATYDLAERRIGPATKASNTLRSMSRPEALATLASRYFKSRGPATLQDFSWWSGLKVSEARTALGSIEYQLKSVQLDGQTFWYEAQVASPKVSTKTKSAPCFLPAFDEYLISYKDRTAAIDLLHQSKVFTKNGLFQPVVVYKQKVVATWHVKVSKKVVAIHVMPFESLPAGFERLCLPGVQDYARFLGRTGAAFSVEIH